jgi:UDP-glucose 4-epimerase
VDELERMFGTFARRRPQVCCTMLRLQPIVGASVGSPINALFRAPVVVTALGFDPRVQVVHEDDAVGALVAAVHAGVRGPVNVAGDGAVSLSRVMRRLGRRALPVAGPLLPAVSGTVARLTGGRPPSDDIVRWLRHGRAVDTTRMREELGFRPRYDTEGAIVAVAEALRRERPEAA